MVFKKQKLKKGNNEIFVIFSSPSYHSKLTFLCGTQKEPLFNASQEEDIQVWNDMRVRVNDDNVGF